MGPKTIQINPNLHIQIYVDPSQEGLDVSAIQTSELCHFIIDTVLS